MHGDPGIRILDPVSLCRDDIEIIVTSFNVVFKVPLYSDDDILID